jgi:hypothetical protein
MFPNRTNYAEIQDGAVVAYPVCPIVVSETGESNLSVNWDGGEYNGKQYVFCHNVEPYCNHEHNLVEGVPQLNPENGLWYRQYQVVPASEEEIQERTTYRKGLMDDQIVREVQDYNGNQAYISSLSQEQQADWLKFIAEVQALPQQSGYPWVPYPSRPHVTPPEIAVERI